MQLSKSQPGHYWSTESSLTALLFFALAYLFVVCALGDFSFSGLVARLLFSLIIVAGVMATFRQHWVRGCAIALAVASLILIWMVHIHPERSLTILSTILGLIFLFFLFGILIVQVFKRGAVTAHRIRGAVVVYLLLGGMWSFFYYLVALIVPQAFNWPPGLAAGSVQEVQQALMYFSFTTLTTTGFGDITPAIPLTRTLAMFEALAGQLYLVITLARLVSLAVICPEPPPKQD